ncbi:MAG TPA: cell envelope integrity protein CreD [Candidatus Kapabacteria bacterium]|nr:cell envelope integrity protein CreD [Candidatus Kapabacteria bacterium]
MDDTSRPDQSNTDDDPQPSRYRSFEPAQIPNPFKRQSRSDVRGSALLKLLLIAFLGLLLLIPANMIDGLVDERQQTRNNAEQEVSSKWGYAQTVGGPILTVPYVVNELDSKMQVIGRRTQFAHFIPSKLSIDGNMRPQVLHRGIYDVVLYGSDLQFTGAFAKPDFRQLGIADQDIMWDHAFVSLGIPDMRGIKETIHLKWNDSTLAFQSGLLSRDQFESGVSATLKGGLIRADQEQHSFSFKLALNGSKQLNFIPLGRETSVKIASSWSNPSFDGNFLPETREITDKGFTASWRILDLNRNFPQQWIGNSQSVAGSEFGVQLLLPVDNYQQTTRSVKYAAMFIGLTFLTFFLVEILNRMRVHPIQYLLVGFAIVLFYLLLLSFSEQFAFGTSYLIGSAGVVGMITLYMGAVFRSKQITMLVFGILSLLYGYLYVLLQMQDYSLMLGSVGLFLILGLVMYLTRKINWYELGKAGDVAEKPAT